MLRDYRHFDVYLNRLLGDIYPQPPDPGHLDMTRRVVLHWGSQLSAKTVLDVGCGQAIAYPVFTELGMEWTGVTLGEDYLAARQVCGDRVHKMDMSFLDFDNQSFDLVYSRHSLEHSPFPLLTLMEWYRVAKNWLMLVLPTPKFWTWTGRNHYAVMSAAQAKFLLERAGWGVIWEDMTDEREFRFVCEKLPTGFDDNKEPYE